MFEQKGLSKSNSVPQSENAAGPEPEAMASSGSGPLPRAAVRCRQTNLRFDRAPFPVWAVLAPESVESEDRHKDRHRRFTTAHVGQVHFSADVRIFDTGNIRAALLPGNANVRGPVVKAGRVFGKRILVADDEPSVRDALKLLLAIDHHQVTEARDGVEAFDLLSSGEFDLLITDYRDAADERE